MKKVEITLNFLTNEETEERIKKMFIDSELSMKLPKGFDPPKPLSVDFKIKRYVKKR
jgi:hypothetical protein